MAGVIIKALPETISEGGIVKLTATSAHKPDTAVKRRVFTWKAEGGTVTTTSKEGDTAQWDTTGLVPSVYTVSVTLREFDAKNEKLHELEGTAEVNVTARPAVAAAAVAMPAAVSQATVRQMVREAMSDFQESVVSPTFRPGAIPVTLRRASSIPTTDQILWMVIRQSTNNLSFKSYTDFIDTYLCAEPVTPGANGSALPVVDSRIKDRIAASRLALPFPGVDAYRKLKAATEVFVLVNSGVLVDFLGNKDFFVDNVLKQIDTVQEEARTGSPIRDPIPSDTLPTTQSMWNLYLENVNGSVDATLPYLAIIRAKLPDVPLIVPTTPPTDDELINCFGILQQKLGYPILLELIWSYWLEEGMLIQAMNRISQRFQNMRGPGDRDPLANLEIDPLRPLNNLLWGYIQDEQHRLSVIRRAHEYDHEYGFTLHGKAVTGLRTADRRSKFLESFHNLLYQCVQFFRQDDDTTVVADGFPVLNSLKETHYLLAQGAHNQFGDLPSTARQEMLMQQWLLSRPEMREFLGGRVMVPYPEPWMDRVDAMKSLLGWTDVSVVHFHDLAVFGEQVLLSVRYGAWSVTNDPSQAANWARYWRPEIQGYIHSYRAVTGVDLTADITDRQRLAERYVAPSVHLRNRLALQRRR